LLSLLSLHVITVVPGDYNNLIQGEMKTEVLSIT